jgi:RNA polymerase sigma-70 factor (ECF subfamily)
MWPEQPETIELLEQAKRGEPQAVDRLLARHREALRRVIGLRLDHALARRVDASDIVQDALLEASRRLNDYLQKPVMPFHLWLRQIALDRIIDAHRRHRQAQRRSLDRERPLRPAVFADRSSIELAAQLVDPQLTPAAAALRAELKRRFEAAVTQLNEDDREIIVLRHFEQLSNQDAAAVLGLSEPAAGMRYLRAMRKLRSVLGQEQ